jgi:preprotein translocase subunit SecA
MTVDRNWIDHIDAMDQLRKGIGLRAYGQVDPVISYKKEGFDMFDEMVERIQRTTISVLLKVKIEVRQAPAQPQPTQNAQPAQPAQPAQGQPVRRPIRRMMPVPLSQMSSQQKPTQPTENKEENK